MVLVEQRTQGMGQGMHGAESFLKRGRAHGRGHQHMAAGDQVIAAGERDGQPFLDQAHGFQGDAVGHGVIAQGAIGLEIVDERVHAGGRGDRRDTPSCT